MFKPVDSMFNALGFGSYIKFNLQHFIFTQTLQRGKTYTIRNLTDNEGERC